MVFDSFIATIYVVWAISTKTCTDQSQDFDFTKIDFSDSTPTPMNTETAPEVQMTDAAANPPPSTEQTPMTNDSAQLPSSSLQTTEETEEVRVESAPEVEAEKEVEVEAQAPPAPVSFLTNSGIDKPKTIAPVVEEVAGNDGGDEVTASALSDSTLKGAPKPKKRTAYFIFMDDMRGKAKQNLVDAGQDVTVGDISKELGRLWKALTEEQKKPYEEQSRLEKAQYQSWLSENPLPISGGGDGGGGNVLDVAIPPAKVSCERSDEGV